MQSQPGTASPYTRKTLNALNYKNLSICKKDRPFCSALLGDCFLIVILPNFLQML
jgi:hypothetical protein